MKQATASVILGVAVWAVVSVVPAGMTFAEDVTRKQPNIVLVFTDDQGWADTSVQMMADVPESKSDFYRTPSLQRMAREGMVFSNAYSPAPTCTPSRGSIQFGKTPARLRQTVVHDVLARSRGIDCRDEVSLAQMIKAADPRYVTAHFGKWGFPPRRPEDAGYDVTDGHTNNGDGDWLSHKDRTPLPPDDPKRIFSTTARAAAFMEQQVEAGRPFFMQVSHYAVHAQHGALKETIEKVRARLPSKDGSIVEYAAMIEDLDTGLGMLLDKLNELQIADNTYVIFTSDNGGGFHSNGPLRGGKANLWEGGIRVPTVVRGPGIAAGVRCDVPVAGWDFFPTIADLIGNRKPLPAGIDGGSLRPLFEHGNRGKVERGTASLAAGGTEALIFHFPWYDNLPMSAIRLGDYKLVKNLNTGQTRLFNLVDDLGEQHDLSRAMPEKARQLHDTLTGYLDSVDAETIDDMRTARQTELRSYIARTQGEIERLQQRVREAAGEEEKQQLQQELTNRQGQMHNHRSAMDRLQTARKRTAW